MLSAASAGVRVRVRTAAESRLPHALARCARANTRGPYHRYDDVRARARHARGVSPNASCLMLVLVLLLDRSLRCHINLSSL